MFITVYMTALLYVILCILRGIMFQGPVCIWITEEKKERKKEKGEEDLAKRSSDV